MGWLGSDPSDPLHMTFQALTKGDIRIIILGGVIREHDGAPYLHSKVDEYIKGDHKNFILDLSAVKSVDSAGLSAILGVYSSARKAGGEAKLCGATGEVLDRLKVTKVLEYYKSFNTLEEALASFGVKEKPLHQHFFEAIQQNTGGMTPAVRTEQKAARNALIRLLLKVHSHIKPENRQELFDSLAILNNSHRFGDELFYEVLRKLKKE